ncbi:hypothetical protein [Niallia sp. RD1]|uniref:hypothetical protein n=1 Tax=Niallia sp. RD1 TaxID=2962858 RepID=UPI0020C198E6|nr:hypothetical protein [Niallia sp. RD1]UTI43733.1 hypothetical protein NKG37_08770 [Niallia sp. RD1]
MKKEKKIIICSIVGACVLFGGYFVYDITSRLSEDEYEEEIEGSFNDISAIMLDFSDIVDIGSDPYIRETDEFKDEVTRISDRLDREIGDVRDIKPPYSKKDEHRDLLKAMDYYEVVAEKMPKTLTNLEDEDMDSVLDNMDKANTIMERSDLW